MKRPLSFLLLFLFSAASLAAKPVSSYGITLETLQDKIKGGWAGQTIGCTYGGPTEFYYRGRMIPDSVRIQWPEHIIKQCFQNRPGLYDDVYMDLTFVDVFDRMGLDAPVDSFANAFARAGYQLWHANLQGRVNVLQGIRPPLSGHWRNNPHADDIDFQIEADYAGLMSPGLVNAASHFCDGIGHIMNYGDGWYGGVWVAAMYSLAFVCDDVETVVSQALQTIPRQSRYYECIDSVLKWYRLYPDDWKRTWRRVQDELAIPSEANCPGEAGMPMRIDADINGAYIAIGLLYGGGDFERTMDIATRCGQDSDCNPASALGVLCTMKGYGAIPSKYLSTLQEVEDMPFAYTDISLNKVYRMSCNQALEVIKRYGGTVSGKKVTIPRVPIETVRYEKSFEGIAFKEAVSIDRSAWSHGNDLDIEFDGCGIVLTGHLAGKRNGDYVALVDVEIDGRSVPTVGINEKYNSSPDHIYHNFDLEQGHHRAHFKVRNPREDKKLRYLKALIYEEEGISRQGAAEPVDYVNTMVGTMSSRQLSSGNTYPDISMPWGTHSWTPQTGKMGNGWAYVYTENKIRGIKMTHQPSPWINDYGFFSLMPVTNGPNYREDDRASWFSHKAETATPYYYSVYLADHDATLEMAPTAHAAVFRITYPERERSYLVIDDFGKGSALSVDRAGRRITGYTVSHDTRHGKSVPDNFKTWFVIDSDTAFGDAEIMEEDSHTYALLPLKTVRGQIVNLKVGASFISLEQAEWNMRELGDGNFERICNEGRTKWNEVLSRIEVQDPDQDNLRTFYSCLYRCLLFPRDFSEVAPDGKRIHYSPYDGKVHGGYLFTDTGFWDTFRSLFALVNLVYPDVAARIQEGLENTYRESGFLPEWASPGHVNCMVGNNSASVVAEAWLKGIRACDAEVLWKAVTQCAHKSHPSIKSTGRLGFEYYDSLGYVPCDKGIKESAARTLEYAYDDWCIWRLGKALGKSEAEIAPYEKASQNFRNLFRPEFSLMSGRRQDGSFPEGFNPFKWGGDFTEGNALHYTWSVFHDPKGLMELMGGPERFESMLDTLFTLPPVFDDSYYGRTIHEIREMQIMNMGNYAHGNQPVQHVIYLYDWVGRPWKTQKLVREVMDRFYSCTPDGYCGDEDNGQTSAWYVFSAMGFYPVCPASCEYAIGTPLFGKITVHLPDGNDIRIDAPGNGKHNCYIKTLTLNGREYGYNYLTHKDLVDGAQLRFTMSPVPVPGRGAGNHCSPYSYSDGNARYVNVFLGTGSDHGMVSPGATFPFSMINVCPDCIPASHAGYDYDITLTGGISVNRVSGVGGKGSGGNVRIKPCAAQRDLHIVKDSERAYPGYYGTEFDNGVKVRLTALSNTAFEQFDFSALKGNRLVSIDFDSAIDHNNSSCGFRIVDEHTIEGWYQSVTVCRAGLYKQWFTLRTDVPFSVRESDSTTTLLEFDADIVNIRLSVSGVSADDARAHSGLDAEISFEQALGKAESAWDEKLSKIEVEGEDVEQKVLLYTSLYRLYHSPVLAQSVDGRFRGTDNRIHEVASGRKYYSSWSMWDTYRTKFPLFSILEPDAMEDFAYSLVQQYITGKKNWATDYECVPTVRTEHSGVILLDAIAKGIVDASAVLPAYEKMKYEADVQLPRKSPDNLMETSYDLWALAGIADALGFKNDAEVYADQAESMFREVWTFVFREISPDFTKLRGNGLYQGSKWQYRWAAPQFIDLTKEFIPFDVQASQLDDFFAGDNFNQCNEPDIHYPFLYAYMGYPEKTQDIVRRLIMDENFLHQYCGDTPYRGRAFRDAVHGYAPEMDEDDGAMSAWYIFAQLGFYPMIPGKAEYIITSPLFDRVTIKSGKSRVTLEAGGRKSYGDLVRAVSVGGSPLAGKTLPHSVFQSDNTLTFIY